MINGRKKMSKVIIKFPYIIKKDQLAELTHRYQADFANGVLVLPGYCTVTVHKDDDVVELDISDNFEEDLDELCRLRSEIAAGAFGENVSREQTESYKKALAHVIEDMYKKKKELYGK